MQFGINYPRMSTYEISTNRLSENLFIPAISWNIGIPKGSGSELARREAKTVARSGLNPQLAVRLQLKKGNAGIEAPYVAFEIGQRNLGPLTLRYASDVIDYERQKVLTGAST